MRIHQLNLRYEPDQDRLIARINTTAGLEIRLWLTRRLTIGFLPLMRKLTDEQIARADALASAAGSAGTASDPKVREILNEFKKDAALQQSDFKTPFKESTEGAATGEDPMLVSEIAVTPMANAHLQVKFLGKLAGSSEKREVQIDLDERLMHGFLHLLEKSFVNSQWGMATVAPADADEAARKVAASSRPQYLN
jgi:hypothetical protein